MAARYRKIDPRIWDDEKFLSLIPREKLVALYCITAQSNRCGLFPFSIARACEHTAIDTNSYAIAFRKVCDTLNWSHDEATRTLFIPTWWKYNPPENPKHLKGCLTDLHDVPTNPLFEVFWKNDRYLERWAKKELRDSYRHSYRKAMPYQKQEQEQNKDSMSAVADDVGGATKKDRKEPTGPHHDLIRFFGQEWQKRYGAKFTIGKDDRGKDCQAFKTILDRCDRDLDRATRIVAGYLADPDPFVAGKKHPVALILPRFNQYNAQAETPAILTGIRKDATC